MNCLTRPETMTEIVLLETIAKVDPEEWNELARGQVTTSYAWLRLVEDTSVVSRQCHCLLARENFQLLAAIFFWEQVDPHAQVNLDTVLFGRLARILRTLGMTVLPALIGNNPAGPQLTILFREGLSESDREGLLGRMLEFLEGTELAKKRTLCFCGIPADDGGLSKAFSSRKYLCLSEQPTCHMDIRWKSFAEYLRALRQQHPRTEKNIHREISLARRAGISFRRLNEPASCSRYLHALVNSHYLRLNGKAFPFRHEFFSQINARLGDNAAIYVAVQEEHIIGIQVRLQSKEEILLSIIGIGENHYRKHAVYFNLGYNQVIRDAIEEGIRRIGFGKLVYDTKIRRGCILSDTNMYIRPQNDVRRFFLRCTVPLRAYRMRLLRPSPGVRRIEHHGAGDGSRP